MPNSHVAVTLVAWVTYICITSACVLNFIPFHSMTRFFELQAILRQVYQMTPN